MATPVVPSQFAVGKNRIIHKPTTATFSFETGHTTFKSINWGRADEQLSSACRQQPLRTVSTLVSTVIVLQPTTIVFRLRACRAFRPSGCQRWRYVQASWRPSRVHRRGLRRSFVSTFAARPATMLIAAITAT